MGHTGLSSRPLRRAPVPLVVAALVAGGTLLVAPVTAGASGAAVVIDSFGNPHVAAGPFTRSVTTGTNPTTSTTAAGTFSVSNDIATMVEQGTGNGASETTLSYSAASAVDLTSSGNNTQILVDFTKTTRTNVPSYTTAVIVSLRAKDSSSCTATLGSDGIPSYYAFNAAFPFSLFQATDCTFKWTAVTSLTLTFAYPQNYTSVQGVSTIQVNRIWATPETASPPSYPTPAVTAPSTAAGSSTTPVDFTIAFTSTQGPAPVTATPPSNDGLKAASISVSGTAFGTGTPHVTVTGGPSTYTAAVSGMTRDGTVTVDVPTHVVEDAFDQFNAASANDPTVTFTYAIPPDFSSANHATFTAGTHGTFTVDALGGSPTPVPTPVVRLTSGTIPDGLTFTAGSGTGTLAGTPDAGTGGTYPLVWSASNAGGTVTQSFTLTVDQAPSITSATTATFPLGSTSTFTVTTTGYPHAGLSETGALPTGVTFTDNHNGTATITGTPAAGTGGVYDLTVKATNGVGAAAPQALTLSVVLAPTITSSATCDATVGLAVDCTVTTTAYPSGAALSLTETGALPTGVTFTDNHNGTATVAGTPAAGTGGVYDLDLEATNGISPAGAQTLALTVDQAPAITSTDTATLVVGTHQTDTIVATGYPDATIAVTGTLPAGVTFATLGNGTATLAGTAAAGSGGVYDIQVTATNGIGTAATQALTVTVDEAPRITSPGTATFTVGTASTVTITTAHAYPANPTLSIVSGTLPSGLTFTTQGDGTATISGTAHEGSGGLYDLGLEATNGVAPAAVQPFALTVDEAPAITSATAARFTVGALSTATIASAGYPYPTITVTGVLPTGITFTTQGNGTATISGTPAAGTGGIYDLTLQAVNGVGTAATQSFTLTDDEAPAITSATTATFTVGTHGTVIVTTAHEYPAPPTLSLAAGTLPTGVTFTTLGDGSATISGTPAKSTGGVYDLTLQATNGVAPAATQSFTLTVNELPGITSGDATTFTVGAVGIFTVTTAHEYPTPPTLSLAAGTLPTGITFTTLGNGTATISGTPAAGTGGIYDLTLQATNGVGTAATQSFTLTDDEAPAITSATATTFTVGTLGTFTVTTAHEYPTPPTLSLAAGTLPAGITFTTQGNGTATISGTPAADTGGVYDLTLQATNGVGTAATQSFTLTDDEAPAITSGDATTFTVGTLGTFTVTTAHEYPTVPTLSIPTGTLPAGVTFTTLGNGTATISGTPAAGTGGVYDLTLQATNGVTPAATQSFTLTDDEAPAITSAATTTFTVGTLGTFTVTTAHEYPTVPTLSLASGTLPAGVTFTTLGDGTATISGTPAAGTGGVYDLTLQATDGVTPAATQSFTLTIDGAPGFSSSAVVTFVAGTGGTATVVSTGYPDADLQFAGTLPTGLTFSTQHNGTATLSGTPAVVADGTYVLTVSAINGITPAAHMALTLTVAPRPAAPPTRPAGPVFVGAVATVATSLSGGGTVSGTTSGASVQVSVPDGSLPPNTSVTVEGVAAGSVGKLLPSGALTLVATACVTWETVTNAAPPAAGPVTVTVTDPAIEPGDVVWLVTTTGLALAGVAQTPGSVAVQITRPGTLVIGPPSEGGLPSGEGYWLAGADGGVFAFGSAGYYGSMGGHTLNSPVVGITATPDGKGYWLVAADGGVFAFGSAGYYGSMGGRPLNSPVVGITATPDGKGYWLVAADGGVFAFGDAQFAGSMGGRRLNSPVVGITATPDGKGYWLVGADGGIFAFGDARFAGSASGMELTGHVVGMARTPDGKGYWLVGADGGVFAFGDAVYHGSMAGEHLNAPAQGVAATPDGKGYWLVGADGGVFAFGDANWFSVPTSVGDVVAIS